MKTAPAEGTLPAGTRRWIQRADRFDQHGKTLHILMSVFHHGLNAATFYRSRRQVSTRKWAFWSSSRKSSDFVEAMKLQKKTQIYYSILASDECARVRGLLCTRFFQDKKNTYCYTCHTMLLKR